MNKTIITFILFISVLIVNSSIKYYGLISLFLILPYFIHIINIIIRERLAQNNSFIGQEAKRQLVFFSSTAYRILILVPTIFIGIALFIFYTILVFPPNKTTELQNIVLLSISGMLFVGFLWQFYLEIRK